MDTLSYIFQTGNQNLVYQQIIQVTVMQADMRLKQKMVGLHGLKI